MGDDASIAKKLDNFIGHEFYAERADSDALDRGLFEESSDKIGESRFGDFIRITCAPRADIYAGNDDLFSSPSDEFIDFLKDLFEGPRAVTTACLDRETEGAKVIASHLNDEIFSRIDVGKGRFKRL